jgi:CheY-like chemotaxis protein
LICRQIKYNHGMEAGRMSERLVLVVDDDEATQVLMTRYLQALGLSVLVAGDGEGALALLREHMGAVRLALIDLAMPRMNGFELAEAIRADPDLSSLPVVALTARVGPEVDSRAAAAGIDQIIQKPFEPARLRGLLSRLKLLGEAQQI